MVYNKKIIIDDNNNNFNNYKLYKKYLIKWSRIILLNIHYFNNEQKRRTKVNKTFTYSHVLRAL